MKIAVSEAMPGYLKDEFSFSDGDFRMIADLARERYGLNLQASKKALVYSRLAKRLRALKLATFKDYCTLLDHADGDDEHQHLVSALTTNVTHFFRELHHFEFLREVVMPSLIRKAQSGESVRLWTSACSAGQEAYCIAAMIIASGADLTKLDIKVLATDIDRQIVDKARRGIYPIEQLTAIPVQYRDLFVDRTRSTPEAFAIRAQLHDIISFGELNLIAPWPMRRPFDVIFCRNAAIYFDKETQHRLWERFFDTLTQDGHLMIGHSERLGGRVETCFRSVGVTTYQKQAVANKRQTAQ